MFVLFELRVSLHIFRYSTNFVLTGLMIGLLSSSDMNKFLIISEDLALIASFGKHNRQF